MESLAGHPAIAVLLPSSERELDRRRAAPGRASTRSSSTAPTSSRASSPRGTTSSWPLRRHRRRPDEGSAAGRCCTTATGTSPRCSSWTTTRSTSLDVEAPGHENDEYIIRPYSAGVDPLARRGDVHPVGRRRRRQRARPPGRDRQRRVGPPRPAAPRVQPEGRRRQDDGRHQPRGGARRARAAGPAGRRRHGDRPRPDVARHGRGPDRHRRLARRDRRRPGADVRRAGVGPQLRAAVLPLSAHPLNTELLEPQRVAGAIAVARRNFDYVIVDLHPSYSPLNRAIFDRADRILVPVTPDLPAIRAVVKLREIADELGHARPAVAGREPRQQRHQARGHRAGHRHPDLLADPVRRPAAGQGQQRGPDAVRDRAAREDHARTSPASRIACWASSASRRRKPQVNVFRRAVTARA